MDRKFATSHVKLCAAFPESFAADTIKPPPPPDPGPHPVYVRLLDVAESNSALKELVELHKARPSFVHQDGSVGWWECEGDEFGGYDGERPEWPCETVGIIAKHLGVSLEDQ